MWILVYPRLSKTLESPNSNLYLLGSNGGVGLFPRNSWTHRRSTTDAAPLPSTICCLPMNTDFPIASLCTSDTSSSWAATLILPTLKLYLEIHSPSANFIESALSSHGCPFPVSHVTRGGVELFSGIFLHTSCQRQWSGLADEFPELPQYSRQRQVSFPQCKWHCPQEWFPLHLQHLKVDPLFFFPVSLVDLVDALELALLPV